jgi:hypothetical protein
MASWNGSIYTNAELDRALVLPGFARVQFGYCSLLTSLLCIRDHGCSARAALRCTLDDVEVCARRRASVCMHAWQHGYLSWRPRLARGLSGLGLEGWPIGG